MTDSTPTVRRAEPAELDRVTALLADNDLPHRDLETQPVDFFVARADADVVGSGGVELYGANALLRSVAVAEPYRSLGYGTALCDTLEAYARRNGVDALYLLTTTASAFFGDRGYVATPRENAPQRIRQTTQFADRCPRSATCMHKRLD